MKVIKKNNIIIILLSCFVFFSCKEKPAGQKQNDKVQVEQQNTVKPVIIEFVEDSIHDESVLFKNVLFQNGLDTTTLYQWQNHTILFDTLNNANEVIAKLHASLHGYSVKLYSDLFYEFNRSHCDSGNIAKEWGHTILTANMVADTVLQNEYLQYHKTQFEEWPEIAKGFCNASFQQLLLYKNGRQLMLVISIPKGESLDKLNPKTTENNPRVDEWNMIMKKYQEGIAGTKKGEVWVELRK